MESGVLKIRICTNDSVEKIKYLCLFMLWEIEVKQERFFVTALTMVSMVNKVTMFVSVSFLVLFEFCLTFV